MKSANQRLALAAVLSFVLAVAVSAQAQFARPSGFYAIGLGPLPAKP